MSHDRMPPEYTRATFVVRKEHLAWLDGWAKGIGRNRSIVCRALIDQFRSMPEQMRRMIVATHAGGGSDEEAGTEPPPDR